MKSETFKEQDVKVLSIIVALVALLFSFLVNYEDILGICLFAALVLMFAVPGLLGIDRHEGIPDQMYAVFVILLTSLMSLTIFLNLLGDVPARYLVFISVAICGIPIIIGAVMAVIFEHDITADVLVSIAIIASVFIGEYEAAAEIAIIMQIGSFLEEATVSSANRRISHLHDLGCPVVRRIDAGVVHNVSVESIKVDDLVRVLPGEEIPVDGVIVSGNSSVDTSSVTGESIPSDAGIGTEVMAGTINMFGSIDIRVTRVAGDSTVSRMAKLLDEADAGRARIVRAADRWATVIVLLALTISALTFFITNDASRAVTVLVVFCPCALVLATPTAIMAAAGNMSHHGILMKDAGAVERLAKVDTFVFDKTGTLTAGNIECCGYESADPGISVEEIGRMVAAVESRSEHPIGKALAKQVAVSEEVEDFTYAPGMGVSGTVAGRKVFAGNRKFLEQHCPDNFDKVCSMAEKAEQDGYHTVLVGADGRSVGIALLSDTVKDSSAYAVRHLWMLGMQRILLTGDSKERAVRMCDDLKMDDVVWECLPSDKLNVVSKIDGDGRSCMIGDGVNDAPSLKRAGVGITMGGVGSDLAIESSDFVFMNDNLSKLTPLIMLCRRTLKTIHLGIAFSLGVNLVATVLAVMGYLGPVGGALVHNIGSVIVIIAAAMVLRYNPWKSGRHKSNRTVSEKPEKV